MANHQVQMNEGEIKEAPKVLAQRAFEKPVVLLKKLILC